MTQVAVFWKGIKKPPPSQYVLHIINYLLKSEKAQGSLTFTSYISTVSDLAENSNTYFKYIFCTLTILATAGISQEPLSHGVITITDQFKTVL